MSLLRLLGIALCLVVAPLAAAHAAVNQPAANAPGTLPPSAAPPADPTAITADTIATAPKPADFQYAIVRSGWVDDLSGTLLYVKSAKGADTSIAVPVPRDRKLLATLIAGGTLDDLVTGTVLTVRYDPRGVVRPEIIIEKASHVEVLENAKVLDRGGSKLFVLTADGQHRGFQIEGGPAEWQQVVKNGQAASLVAGAKIRIAYDPSGRLPLEITVVEAPPSAKAADRGCGCRVAAGAPDPGVGAAVLLGLVLIGLVALRRRSA
jgi:MYXO-CTERM domain-containing protein